MNNLLRTLRIPHKKDGGALHVAGRLKQVQQKACFRLLAPQKRSTPFSFHQLLCVDKRMYFSSYARRVHFSVFLFTKIPFWSLFCQLNKHFWNVGALQASNSLVSVSIVTAKTPRRVIRAAEAIHYWQVLSAKDVFCWKKANFLEIISEVGIYLDFFELITLRMHFVSVTERRELWIIIGDCRINADVLNTIHSASAWSSEVFLASSTNCGQKP